MRARRNHSRGDAFRITCHQAAYEGHEAVLEVLLRRGADVGTRDLKGYTVLMCAAAGGRHRLVDLLCALRSEGVALEATLDSGEDAAILAVNNGFNDLASKLTRRAYINLRTSRLGLSTQ